MRVALVYFGAGGGHQAAAKALVESIRRQDRPWQVELVNLDVVLEPLDLLYQLTGLHSMSIYNWAVRHGVTFASALCLASMHAWIRMTHLPTVWVLRKLWRRSRPDLVLSVIPHYNRALYQSLQSEHPGTPFVTLLTDLADYPPRFWFERQDQHFICGTSKAVEQAVALCSPNCQIWRVSGMVLHPRFHDRRRLDRVAERQRLGLDPDLPTGVVLFGGYGSTRMLQIARCLSNSRVQMIFLCGRNARLAARLRDLALPYPAYVHEFTDRVPFFMGLSDFFVGKPGPGALSEALAMRLPVIVEANHNTMVQERFNVHWIRQERVGLVIQNFADLPAAVEELLKPAVRGKMLRRIARINNTAAYEVPAVLEKILTAAGCFARPTKTGPFQPIALGSSQNLVRQPD
jgi:UDP-N-acetylglucosamine:LPS N-acetylglucosamine transferase